MKQSNRSLIFKSFLILALILLTTALLTSGLLADYHGNDSENGEVKNNEIEKETEEIDEEAEEIEAREIIVETHNFYFEPEVINVEPGEEIKFTVKNPSSAFHTFTVYHSRTEREEAVVDISLSAGEEKSVTVTMPDEEQELYLVCLPHEGVEMIGSIIAGELPEETDDGEETGEIDNSGEAE